MIEGAISAIWSCYMKCILEITRSGFTVLSHEFLLAILHLLINWTYVFPTFTYDKLLDLHIERNLLSLIDDRPLFLTQRLEMFLERAVFGQGNEETSGYSSRRFSRFHGDPTRKTQYQKVEGIIDEIWNSSVKKIGYPVYQYKWVPR